MSSSSRRHHARSPAAGPLDDDDLLCEILLRLPPQPSSLPRASAVCKRWRRLVSDPGFFRRFRLRHRRNPPLLGFFDRYWGHSFLPTLEAPNRIPPQRFSLQHTDDFYRSTFLGCRHGLFLVFLWKPRQRRQPTELYKPHAFCDSNTVPAGETPRKSLPSGVDLGWGGRPLPHLATEPGLRAQSSVPTMVNTTDDAVLAGDSLYWVLAGNLSGILECDLVKQTLAVIRVPVDMCGNDKCWKMMRAEGGGLGCLVVSHSDCTAQLWKRRTDFEGVASWGLTRTIELDKLLSLKSEEKSAIYILGIAEENNVVLLWTMTGLFMINLESLKFKTFPKTDVISGYHAFESVYSAGAYVDDGQDGAGLLLNT